MNNSKVKAFALFCCAAVLTTHTQGWFMASVASCTSKAHSAGTKETFTIQDRPAFLILPDKSKSSRPLPWVWYAPTLRNLPGKAEKWMFETFLDHGIAIAGVDVGESYGSPRGRAIYSALHKELVEKRGMAKKACLLARSRGGLMLYNWASEHSRSVACIAGIYPVCNLSSYPGLGRACRAYGMTKEQLAERLNEHNPIDRLAPLAKAKVPIFHMHGDKDRVVPLDKNSAELKRRYDKLGGEMTLEVVKGQGHNLYSGWFHSQELVDFVIAHARDDKPKKAEKKAEDNDAPPPEKKNGGDVSTDVSVTDLETISKGLRLPVTLCGNLWEGTTDGTNETRRQAVADDLAGSAPDIAPPLRGRWRRGRCRGVCFGA